MILLNFLPVGFQLVDDSCGCITLIIEQFFPDKGVLIACSVIGQNIFIHIFQKFPELCYINLDTLECMLGTVMQLSFAGEITVALKRVSRIGIGKTGLNFHGFRTAKKLSLKKLGN